MTVHTIFEFLHQSSQCEEEYVRRIEDSLKFAFEQAQILQATMAEKNQDRKTHNEYKPGSTESTNVKKSDKDDSGKPLTQQERTQTVVIRLPT